MPVRHTKQSFTKTNHTRSYINIIRSLDDIHCDARNMWRDEINKYIKKCVKLVISKNLLESSKIVCLEILTQELWEII